MLNDGTKNKEAWVTLVSLVKILTPLQYVGKTSEYICGMGRVY